MKKASIISINLKFLRIPFILSLAALIFFAGNSLAVNPPSIRIRKEFVNFFFASQFSENNAKVNYTSVFSLLSPQKESAVLKAPAPEFTPAEVSAATATPQKSTVPKVFPPVQISNTTDFNLKEDMYSSRIPDFLNRDFSVLIVHTHTTESYTPSEKYNYVPTDTDRTTDKDFNMVRIGKEIEKTLRENGIKVFHDTTINDYPSYNGSYNKSAANVSNHIKNDPSIKVVLDVHRDAIEGKNGEKVKYTTKIDSRDVAKVMLVVGSNLTGLEHTNWKENLSFAYSLQQHIEWKTPGLMRPINFRSQRFNQQLAPGAIIVEVGTNGNTMDEALLGAVYFAEGLSDYIKAQK